MNARVLVADDEPAMTAVMALALRAEGFEVIEAHDGREALTLALSERPDAILLDVMMPGMGGLDITRRLRNDPAFEHTPIVLFSSLDERSVDWKGAGADAFLQKVFSVAKLPDLLENLLRRRASYN